jgi:hypothetical protein
MGAGTIYVLVLVFLFPLFLSVQASSSLVIHGVAWLVPIASLIPMLSS